MSADRDRETAWRFWLDWWRGRKGVGPYRRDALVWWLTGGWWRAR